MYRQLLHKKTGGKETSSPPSVIVSTVHRYAQTVPSNQRTCDVINRPARCFSTLTSIGQLFFGGWNCGFTDPMMIGETNSHSGESDGRLERFQSLYERMKD